MPHLIPSTWGFNPIPLCENKMPIRLIYILFFTAINLSYLNAQTCCSGGVPLAANLGLPPSQKKATQFRLSYDLNILKTVKTGTEKLNDHARTRCTHSILFETGYSFNDRFSLDLFYSWIRQVREIKNNGNRDFTATNGFGDAVFLLKYNLIKKPNNGFQFTTGIGLKTPFGKSDLRREDGLTIVADLQPGSGAYDGIFWNQFIFPLLMRPTMNLTANAIYSYKGKNKDYLGSQEYQFGGEAQIAAGMSDRFFIKNNIIDPFIEFRFRRAGKDNINGSDISSTGGSWIFLTTGFSFWFNPEVSINTGVSVHLYANVVGTQLSPTRRFNIGFYYLFLKK